MDRNQKFVVTINRELGSGGRTVGRLLAEKLGVEFFDKAHVRAIEEKFNLTIDEIERLKGKKESWWADFMRVGSIQESSQSFQYIYPGFYALPFGSCNAQAGIE